MSKKAKKASKLKNLQRKRARKAANKARYQQMARDGVNSKSKRFKKKSKFDKKARPVKHLDAHCGNNGCKRCFPREEKEKVFVKAKDLKLVA